MEQSKLSEIPWISLLLPLVERQVCCPFSVAAYAAEPLNNLNSLYEQATKK